MLIQAGGRSIHSPAGLVLAGEVHVPEVQVIHFIGEGGMRNIIEDRHREMEHQQNGEPITFGKYSAPPRLGILPRHAYFLAEKWRNLNSES